MRSIGRRNLGVLAVLLNHSRPSSVSSFGLFQTARRKSVSPTLVSRHSSSSSSLSSTNVDAMSPDSISALKVLALHGSGGTAEEFPQRLAALEKAVAFHGKDGDKLNLEITAVQAPFVKENGFSWWTMPTGVRSFNAKEYTGFEESAEKVLDVWEQGGFDVVLGHSQGAILIGALLALKRTPYHPSGGYIMNGVSFPNPYTEELESLNQESYHDDGDGAPRILFLLGKRDKIAPNSTGEKLRGMLQRGGFDVTSCYHDGGHGFPDGEVKDQAMETIAEWIIRGQRSK